MLTIMINWLYVLFTTFCLGYGIFCFTEKGLGYRMKHIGSILIAGLIGATVYAQIFSLVYKVGLAANIILLGVCALIIGIFRKRLLADIRNFYQSYPMVKKAILLALFLIWAYFTSRGYILYDSDLYHGQSIRWIEEYGVVKGLGNLHERFAYNSSFFAVSALYSMKFLTGQSLHALSGFYAFLLSMKILDAVSLKMRTRKLLISDFARMGAVYYLTTICDEVVSPASDYATMCMIFYIVIQWLDILEEEKHSSAVPYAYLCVCGVYTISLKLTAGLILILVLKPACMLLKEKRLKEILLYFGMGILVILPWFARTVMISGYLLYPFPALDLFSVDWKMHVQRVTADANNIKTWGRALYNGNLVDVPITSWFPGWFQSTLSVTEKMLIIADGISLAGLLCFGLWVIVKKKKAYHDILLVLLTLGTSWLFWQGSAPLARYGYAYIILLPAIFAGTLLVSTTWYRIVILIAAVYGSYKLCMLAGYAWSIGAEPYYVNQKAYGSYELNSVEIDGFIFYTPVVGDRTGYEYFPAAPEVHIKLRGDTLRDGFLFQ
ncbi:MAG: hypothetical protein J1E83_06435 [Lachnospiraceae bacterium]|nr:hypothetical protein [Lachnospiraceae bacterium]